MIKDCIVYDGDVMVGKCIDIMKKLREEISYQCLGDIDYQELIWNVRKIIDLLAELEDNMVKDNEMIVVRENPMGSLYYEIYGGEE